MNKEFRKRNRNKFVTEIVDPKAHAKAWSHYLQRPEFRRMSFRENKWFSALMICMNPTEAVRMAYPKCKHENANRVSYYLMRKFNLAIAELLEYMGLGLEEDVKDLIRLRKAKVKKYFANTKGIVVDEREDDDNMCQLEALKLCLRLKGLLADKVEVSGEIKLNLADRARNARERVEKRLALPIGIN